jgi:hypothetical protein
MALKLRGEFSSWLLRPPYDGVVWLAWLYVVGACLYAGGGPFAGDLVWFDDRVRLVQVFDWLNGQSWYDRTIMRVNAPEGFHTIWSRVVDLPVAGIVAALQNFIGQMHAGMVAATVIPLIETLLLFFAASYFARPLAGGRNARLVTLFVLFGSCVNPEAFTLAGFQVGMIGHHAWYVLLTLMLFGAMGRLLLASGRRPVLVGGLAIGGLLTVGIEGLPLIAGACGLIALIGWRQNRQLLVHDAFRLTALGALAGLALLPANQPPGKLLGVSFAEPSILGPMLMLAAAVFFAGQRIILRRWGGKPALSLGLTALLGASIAALLIHLFPQFLNGAAAALSPEERRLAAGEHQEAMTLFHLARNNLDYFRMIAPPLLAAAFALYRLTREKTRRRQAVVLFYLGLVVLAFALASTYSRFFHYLGLAASPWLLLLWLAATRHFAPGETRALKSFAAYVLIGPLWLWLVPAANFNQPFGTDVLLFPAKLQTEPQHCDTRSFTDFLDLRYGADKTIIVPMYKSDHFLLHTKLKIFFLANFPSQNKFIDAKAFYETGSPDEARDIAERGHIDLVAVCTKAYLVSTRSTLTNRLLRGHMSFGQLLVTGIAPDWLKPVPVAALTPWLLFEVDRDKLPDEAETPQR